MLTFITGGIKSGKSAFAESLAHSSKQDIFYIATAVCTDDEMVSRISKHRQRRPISWHTIEESYDLLQTFKYLPKEPVTILLDCLTTYLSNILWKKHPEIFQSESDLPENNSILSEIQILAEKFVQSQHNFIVVSNEVGMSLIPGLKIGRIFCDIQGAANQIFAKQSQNAYLIVSGLEIKLK